jgi:hypothetical protein
MRITLGRFGRCRSRAEARARRVDNGCPLKSRQAPFRRNARFGIPALPSKFNMQPKKAGKTTGSRQSVRRELVTFSTFSIHLPLHGDVRMKRLVLLPTNIFWIVGHIVMAAAGIFLTIIAAQSDHKDILLGVGGSLIAAGIAGEILFLYVVSSQNTRDKLDLISAAGLQQVFETRSVSIRNEYHTRLRGAKEVDILGFGLSSFRQDYGNQFSELSFKTRFRILLLDPDFPSSNESIASIRDREEGNNVGNIKRDIEAFENTIRTAQGLNKDNFSARRLAALPSINVFRIDDELFWGPYLIANQSRNMPTLLVRRGGFLYDQIKAHFDELWASDQFSKRMRWTRRRARRATLTRTAKSCGPDAPMLASSSWEASFSRATVTTSRSPGRARRKPLKPLRRKCRVFR